MIVSIVKLQPFGGASLVVYLGEQTLYPETSPLCSNQPEYDKTDLADRPVQSLSALLKIRIFNDTFYQ